MSITWKVSFKKSLKKGNSLKVLRRITFDISGKLKRYSKDSFSEMKDTVPTAGPYLFIYLKNAQFSH